MYKARIKKWNTRKNFDWDEVEDILKEYHAKKDIQKNPVIKRHGKVIGASKIHYFMKRSLKKATPPDLALQKVPPHLIRGYERVRSVSTPEQFLLFERMLERIDTYFKGSFDSGAWRTRSQTEICYSIRRGSSGSSHAILRRLLGTAFELFKSGDILGTEKSWASISAMLSDFVRSDDVRNWCLLCEVAIDLRRLGWFEVAREILRQSSRLAAVYHGVGHPFHQLCGYLSMMPYSEIENMADLGWRKASDVLEAVLGEMHISVLLERSRMLWSLDGSDLQGKLVTMKEVLEKCKERCSLSDSRTLQMRIYYANLLREDGQNSLALDELNLVLYEVAKAKFDSAGSLIWQGLNYDANLLVGDVHLALNQMDSAEYHYQESFRIASTVWGWQDSRVLRSLVDLEQLLSKLGRSEEAAHLRTQRIKAQEEQNAALDAALGNLTFTNLTISTTESTT